jgi:formamidopyrimidine-DNA glycosylase
MPELPEVETTRRGILPWVEGERVRAVEIRERRLRWPIPTRLAGRLVGRRVSEIRRRAKYLIFHVGDGCVLLHLGMSGSLRVIRDERPPQKHDHVDIVFEGGHRLRFRDPRRFGCLLWTRDPDRHPLLAALGPEPMGPDFDGHWLWERSRGRKVAVKSLLMNAQVVVGVGNIYANEALFRAGIHPSRAAGRVSAARYERLAAEVRAVLDGAIEAGGTTLRDFARSDGEPGGYGTQLDVYGREGEACIGCGATIRRRVVGQRSTYWCPDCQR